MPLNYMCKETLVLFEGVINSVLPIYGSIYNLDFVLRYLSVVPYSFLYAKLGCLLLCLIEFFSQCFSRDQGAELTEIANVTRAVCLTHRFPLALTWIPCDYTWGAVDDISKSHCRLCNSGFLRTCELSIERTASYSDEEMQGFVNACEQLFLNTGQGAAGQAHRTYLPSFEPDVKEKHVSEYPRAHHVRKYNLNAAVAIVLRSTGAGCSYILEFFLPHDRYFRAARFGYNPED